MIKKIVWFVGLWGLMCACYQDLHEKEPATLSEDYSISKALAYADEMFAVIEGGTRSVERRVSSVEYIGQQLGTRGDDTGLPLYYLVNYENESGFAVLSADRNNCPVMAIGEEGNLSFEDTIGNKALAKFFRSLDNRSNDAATLASNVGLTKPNPFDSIYYAVYVEKIVRPKLTSSVQHWFGNFSEEIVNKYSSIAVSFAQAMTCYSWPKVWDVYSDVGTISNVIVSQKELNWNLINSYIFSSKSSYVDDGYKAIDEFLSLVSDYFIPRGMFDLHSMRELCERCGYDVKEYYIPPLYAGGNHREEPMGPDEKNWVDDLENDKIIVIGDFVVYNSGYTDDLECISWVVDGFIKYSNAKPKDLEKYNTNTMFHCVWGKGRGCNGYFVLNKGSEFVAEPLQLDDNLPWRIDPDLVLCPQYYTLSPKK